MRRLNSLVCVLSCLWGVNSLRAEHRLRTSDVLPAFEEMLNYHVEHKELSPLLLKRAFKVSIEQFDPYRVYLLAQEVEPYLEPSNRFLSNCIQSFKQGQLTEFNHLYALFQRAVERGRVWRRDIQKEQILRGVTESDSARESYLGYAKTEEQLKQRMATQLARLLLEEKKAHGMVDWTPEQRAQIFHLWQKRFLRKEEPYLLLSKDEKPLDAKTENYLCLHMLRALAKSLDAHTSYFSPEEAAELRTSLEKQFEGVGVVLREGIEGVAIADLLKGGPAERSGNVHIGDLLVEIDGKSTIGMAYELVLEEMKGKGKREIQLGFKRAGSSVIQRVSLTREKIVMQDERLQVSITPFAGGIIGKLNLPSFYEGGHLSSADQDIREAIRKLKREGDLKGLILDMRENAGGFLSQAVKIAGLFITRGVIVISKYAHGEMRYLRDIDGRIYYDGPLVVLTSKGSASAAEIVAQALQDYGAAVVVGDERTYGKGTIQYQTVTDEQAKSFFKVTVGRYYTVSGRSTQIEGVKADLQVPSLLAPFTIGERYLEYPLPSDRVAPAYLDPLSDIDERNRAWFQKNYLPNLQAPRTFWQKLIPRLAKNSAHRLKSDKNFTLLMQDQERYQGLSIRSYVRPAQPAWGKEDLQMAEAVNILKDMIRIRASEGVEKQLSK